MNNELYFRVDKICGLLKGRWEMRSERNSATEIVTITNSEGLTINFRRVFGSPNRVLVYGSWPQLDASQYRTARCWGVLSRHEGEPITTFGAKEPDTEIAENLSTNFIPEYRNVFYRCKDVKLKTLGR